MESTFMREAEAFMLREPVGSSLPASCIQRLLDAIDVFEEEPELRDRSFHAFKGAKGFWSFSLLGFVAAECGFPLVTHSPRNGQEVLLREFLGEVGFTYYDQLCLNEINSHSLNEKVLRERVLHFATTGGRMPLLG